MIQDQEFIKRVLDLVKPHVYSVKSIQVTQKVDIKFAFQSWDLTVFYKKTKFSAETNDSWLVFGNKYKPITTKHDLLKRIENNIDEL